MTSSPIGDFFKRIDLNTLSVGTDGRLKIGGDDVLIMLRRQGVEFPKGYAVPLNNDHGCNNIC